MSALLGPAMNILDDGWTQFTPGIRMCLNIVFQNNTYVGSVSMRQCLGVCVLVYINSYI